MKITLNKEYEYIKTVVTNYINVVKVKQILNEDLVIDNLVKSKYFKTAKLYGQNFICRKQFNDLMDKIADSTNIHFLAKKYNFKKTISLLKHCNELNIKTFKLTIKRIYISNIDAKKLESYIWVSQQIKELRSSL